MKRLRKTIYIILYVIAVFFAICSIVSIFRNAEIRYLKMLDYPRIQFFIANQLYESDSRRGIYGKRFGILRRPAEPPVGQC